MRRCKAKGVKTRCYHEGVGQFDRRFQREKVVPGEYYFGFYKTRYILLSDSANCTVRAVVLTQYRRVTDGQTDRQTDGIAIASTVLAMRALRRAVKTKAVYLMTNCHSGCALPCSVLAVFVETLCITEHIYHYNASTVAIQLAGKSVSLYDVRYTGTQGLR